METVPGSGPEPVDPAADLARCFLRLANLPMASLWQACWIRWIKSIEPTG
jgi:hypothetical protein